MTTTQTRRTASDVMVADPVCVDRALTLQQLARVFDEHEISGAPVVDESGRVIGVVSKTDIIRRCMEGTLDVPPAYLFETILEQEGGEDELTPEPVITVEDLMSEGAVTVAPTATLAEVARLMSDNHIHRVVVADAQQFPLGIITSLDLLRAFPT